MVFQQRAALEISRVGRVLRDQVQKVEGIQLPIRGVRLRRLRLL